jgi:hypothetical protein
MVSNEVSLKYSKYTKLLISKYIEYEMIASVVDSVDSYVAGLQAGCEKADLDVATKMELKRTCGSE